ncbi:MAG: ABC transporter substrate-binding protein, partial [Hyphomicrobiales bacterium]
MRTLPISATGHGLRLTALAATMAVFMAPSQARAQALNFCADTALAGLDPALHTTAPALKLGARQIFDRLVENTGDGASVVPSLAVSWEVSSDGRQYTFKLRQGVVFHSVDNFKPTRELAPRDVVFSFQRQISKTDPFSPAQIYGAKNTAVKAGSLIGLIETVEPVGDDMVRFTLKQPDSGFLTMLAMESASILSAEYGAKLAKAGSPLLLDRVPVGTGPFKVAPTKTAKSKKKRRARKAAPYTGAPITELNLVANGAYWRGAPTLGGLRIITTPNPVARFVGIETGACQIAQRPAPADLAALRAQPGVSVVEAGGTSVLYLAINTANKPFNDPWVRKALAKAIDRKALAKATVQSARPTASLTGDAGDLPVADTGAARGLLKGAGALGVSINLLVPSITPGNPGAIPAAISDAWTQAGAKVTLVPVSWSQLPTKLASANY